MVFFLFLVWFAALLALFLVSGDNTSVGENVYDGVEARPRSGRSRAPNSSLNRSQLTV